MCQALSTLHTLVTETSQKAHEGGKHSCYCLHLTGEEKETEEIK